MKLTSRPNTEGTHDSLIIKHNDKHYHFVTKVGDTFNDSAISVEELMMTEGMKNRLFAAVPPVEIEGISRQNLTIEIDGTPHLIFMIRNRLFIGQENNRVPTR